MQNKLLTAGCKYYPNVYRIHGWGATKYNHYVYLHFLT